MTPLVWANFPLALLFLLAWVGIPPWMAHHDPDYAAHPYLAAKAANTTGGKPETGCRCRLSSTNGNREEPRGDPEGDTAIPALTSQRRRRRLPGVRRLSAASPMLNKAGRVALAGSDLRRVAVCTINPAARRGVTTSLLQARLLTACWASTGSISPPTCSAVSFTAGPKLRDEMPARG